MSKTSIAMYSTSTSTTQENIAKKNAWGGKRTETFFVNNTVGGDSNGGGVSYSVARTRNAINVQGKLVATGTKTDFALQGEGMFLVLNPVTGEFSYTRRGDGRINQEGRVVNGSDQVICALKFDKDGNLPKNSSDISSAVPMNLGNIKCDPKATSAISIAMNFSSAQEALKGAGVTAAVKKSGINANANTTKNDVLFTESLPNAGGLTLGDRFTFTSTPPGLAKTIEYGGLAIAVAPTVLNPIFGATKVGDKFSIGGLGNQVPEGATLKIALSNGTNYIFTVASNAQSSNKTFNSIQTLADAINKVGGLKAKIDLRNNSLYIASGDPDLGMTFTDGNGGTFVDKLGLIDVPTLAAAQATGGGLPTQRFNNLQTLNAAVNSKADDFSLKATIENGNVKITSLLSTDKFKIEGQSLGVRTFNKAQLGDGTEQNRATIQITAPQHGLQTGDLIQLSAGLHGQAPAGIYAVSVSSNDTFSIFLLSSDAGAAAGGGAITDGLPASGAVAPAGAQLAVPAGATWQKIAGQKFDSVSAALNVANPGGGGVAAGGNGVNNAARIQINSAAHGLAIGDVLLISGGGAFNVGAGAGYDVNLPDGYYIVKATNAADFQIEPLEVAATGAIAVVAGTTKANITYQKVGRTEAGAGVFNNANSITTFDTTGLFSVPAAVTNLVTLNMSSNNYNIGDTIRFTGLPVGYTIDGLAIENDVNYKVTATAAGSVTFEVAVGMTAGNALTGTYSANALPLTNLGPDFRIDNVSRLFEYFSIAEGAGEELDEVYNADDVEKSLAGNEGLKSTESFIYPLSLYDSLGENYNLMLKFAKIGKNEWAVELVAEEDPITGQFDISEAKDDGQIKNGRIRFDANGKFLSAGSLEGALNITRKNGSASNQITIDWKNELAMLEGGSITQYESASPFNIEKFKQDGYKTGNTISFETKEGIVSCTFDNGQTKDVYQMVVVQFPNLNGLKPSVNDTYQATNDSGPPLLKRSGEGGVAEIISGVLEASNIDTTKELLDLQDYSNDIRISARTVNVANKNFQTILSEFQ